MFEGEVLVAYRLRSQDKAKQGERSKDKLLKRHRGHNSNVFNKLKMDQNIFQFYKQGGRSCTSARAALTERSGSSTNRRTPNIHYFVAKLSIVAIYALFERLL